MDRHTRARRNSGEGRLTDTADALFAALAEQLDEPFATKDGVLATEVAKHSTLTLLRLDHARWDTPWYRNGCGHYPIAPCVE